MRRWLVPLLLALPLLVLLDRGTDRRARPEHQAERLEAGGFRWRVLRGGPRVAGDTTLVLLHGYGEHLLTWRHVFDPLARRYRVVALDLPGFGATDKPEGPYSLPRMAAWVGAFLARWVPPPVVLIGHSMGGAIAAQVALDLPGNVVGLVLIDPAGLDAGLGDLERLRGPAGAKAIGWWEAARAFITPVHDPDWMREPAALQSYDPTADPAYRRSSARVLQDFDFAGLGRRFEEIRQPVRLVWGRYDPVIPYETAGRLLGMLPCATLVSLNTLHRPQVERPDTVATVVLDFLARPACH